MTLLSQHLVASEDELLDILLKWIEMNPNASKNDVDRLHGLIKLDLLQSTQRIQELSTSSASRECPLAFLTRLSQLGLHRMQADDAMRNICRQTPVDPRGDKLFIGGIDFPQDFPSCRKRMRYFSFRNFAMFAFLHEEDGNLLLCLGPEHRIAAGRSSFHEQAERTKMDLGVVETSMVHGKTVPAQFKATTVAFKADDHFIARIVFPSSSLRIQERNFWCFFSDNNTRKRGSSTCDANHCTCKRQKT